MTLQGPRAETILALLTPAALGALPRNGFVNAAVAGRDAMVARTGYTGEDGFEIYCPAASAGLIWDALLDKGAAHGLEPAGLGARDTLRLEACLALYGNEIDETTTMLEAGLGFIVKLDKQGGFIGSQALARQKAEGLARKLVGFEMVERGIARHGYPVEADGARVGLVTSGTYGPFVRRNVGLTYLPIDRTAEGTAFHVIIRGKPVAARVTRTPFYKRPAPVQPPRPGT
jgi:aminomethyltransferase